MKRDYFPWLIALFLASSLAIAAPIVQIAGTGPWGSNVPAVGVPLGATDPDGKLQKVKLNASNEVIVSCADCGGEGGGAVAQSGTWTVGLSAGANNIGDVDVLTLPSVTGTVSVSNFPTTQPVSLAALPSLVAGTANIGDVDVLTLPSITGTVSVSNFPGTQPISGAVSVSNFPATQPVSLASLPSLVAGTANIGDVDVLTLPAITGAVSVSNFPATQPVSLATLPALVAGTANIGDVDVLTLPALPAGGNNIGDVDVLTLPGVAQSGTWTVQPGNTANTTPWLFNGDIDHDVANTLKNIQIAGNASPYNVPPTVVSANGDRVRAWFDRSGASIVRPRRLKESYTVVYRLAETAARLDQTFTQVANTNKQWATLHHAVGATKELRLQRVVVFITAWSVATQGVLELRSINAAPATGNPAVTPAVRSFGNTASEAVAFYLPTTAGTETAANAPLASFAIDQGVLGAVSVVNPFVTPREVVLYSSDLEDDQTLQPTCPAATLCGWAVVLRTVSNPAVRMTVVATFTEEVL